MVQFCCCFDIVNIWKLTFIHSHIHESLNFYFFNRQEGLAPCFTFKVSSSLCFPMCFTSPVFPALCDCLCPVKCCASLVRVGLSCYVCVSLVSYQLFSCCLSTITFSLFLTCGGYALKHHWWGLDMKTGMLSFWLSWSNAINVSILQKKKKTTYATVLKTIHFKVLQLFHEIECDRIAYLQYVHVIVILFYVCVYDKTHNSSFRPTCWMNESPMLYDLHLLPNTHLKGLVFSQTLWVVHLYTNIQKRGLNCDMNMNGHEHETVWVHHSLLKVNACVWVLLQAHL